jgi:SAM-dependent methyltransferase
MALARAKSYPADRVRFALADAYALSDELGRFDAALAVFWWSHIPLSRIQAFVASLHRRLEPGARVVLMDNLYVSASSTPIAERDAEGNSYQLRRLADGSETRVLKNFPSEVELRSQLPLQSYRALEYYWVAEYALK